MNTRHKEVGSFPYVEDFAMARMSEVLLLNLRYEIGRKKLSAGVVTNFTPKKSWMTNFSLWRGFPYGEVPYGECSL